MAIPPLLLSFNGHAGWLVPKFWLIFFFISGISLLTVVTIQLVAGINNELYAQAFLGATTIKILAGMFFALFYLLKTKVDRYIFVADFFYVYFLNMGFEIYGLLRTLRNQKSK